MTAPAHALVGTHADTLAKARAAIAERGYWSAYPESPSPRVYGESAAADGKKAFEAYLGSAFPLEQPGTTGEVSSEVSPFGVDLGVTYPHGDVDALVLAARAAMPEWRDAGPDVRTAVCIEILARLHEHIFELANAVHVHDRPGVRDGVPGRWRARARPRAGVDRVRPRGDDAPPGARPTGRSRPARVTRCG